MNLTASKKQLQKRLDLDRMPKWKARVEIAKDVIAALGAGRLQARHQHYLIGHDLIRGKSLREQLDKADCEVCARGALFVSIVARKNRFDVPDIGAGDVYIQDEQMHERLTEHFTPNQLDLIEGSFEGAHGFMMNQSTLTPAQQATANAFYERLREGNGLVWADRPRNRMLAIMKNIIRNKGTFKPKEVK